MVENCNNCGEELFTGQQFCRKCGAPIHPEAGEAPTQLLESGSHTGIPQDASTTSKLPGQNTDPSMRPPPTSPQAPIPGYSRTSPLVSAPAGKHRGRWLLPFVLGVALAGLGAMLFGIHSWRERSETSRAREMKKVIVTPREAPLPPEAIEALKNAGGSHDWEGLGSLALLDETEAIDTASQTVITKTYPLDPEASFAIRNVNGDVTVEGWDQSSAEVRIIKRGGSLDERREARVMYGIEEARLSLMTTAKRGGPVEVRYEIKLPRRLGQLEINSDESRVRVALMDGTVVADVKQGAIEFVDVTGIVRGKLIKGILKVSYPNAAPDGTQEFSVVRGNVEIDLADKMNTDIKAETMDGDVEVDQALGLKVTKSAAGKHLIGRLGDGSDPLLIKVVNGDIKFMK